MQSLLFGSSSSSKVIIILQETYTFFFPQVWIQRSHLQYYFNQTCFKPQNSKNVITFKYLCLKC